MFSQEIINNVISDLNELSTIKIIFIILAMSGALSIYYKNTKKHAKKIFKNVTKIIPHKKKTLAESILIILINYINKCDGTNYKLNKKYR